MPARREPDRVATLMPLRRVRVATPGPRERARDGGAGRSREARTTDDAAGEHVLWFVTVTVSGPPLEDGTVRSALERLSAKQAFVASARFAGDRAEIRYWDEADSIAVVIAQGLRLWSDHESGIGLPGWSVVGLEVVDRETTRRRWQHEDHPQVLVLGEIRPFEDDTP